MNNPYRDTLLALAGTLTARSPEAARNRPREKQFQHWDADNEWVYPELANHLLIAAYALTADGPTRGDPGLRRTVADYVHYLVDAAAGDRWYHLAPGQGDPNIDRFAGVPFCEAFLLVGDTLPAALREAVLARLRGIAAVQVREYGHGPQLRGDQARLYPNMDAYYCLLMALLHRILGDPEYRAESATYLDRLAQAQFSGGAWTYIGGTNECPIYHDLAVLLLARLAALDDDPRSLAQLRRSLPYYPSVLSPAAVPEYYTDCWWKHTWSPQLAYAPDTLASVLGDGPHRAIGDLTRAATLDRLRDSVAGRLPSPDNIGGLFAVYAAMAWRDVAPAPFFRPRVWHDANIEGPRGQFADWSWAATGRHGGDTVVGAMAHGPAAAVQALLAVTPFVEARLDGQPDTGMTRFALAITPPDTRGDTTLAGDTATFRVRYRLAAYRSVWAMEPFPFAWTCTQTWRLGPRDLHGQLDLTSDVDQTSPPPGCVLRFGRGDRLEETPGGWRFGPFTLAVDAPAFPCRTIATAPTAPYLTTHDAVQLRLATRPAWGLEAYPAGASFRLAVHLAFAPTPGGN